MSSLLDQIDKENDSSVDSSLMLFNASSHSRHRVSTDINEDLFQSFDDYKHSTGILVDDKEIISRKFDFLGIFLNILKCKEFLIGYKSYKLKV
jgi:hypothetical protein